MKYNVVPYIMRFEKYKESYFKDIYTQLARWCNQPSIFKKRSFKEFIVDENRMKNNKKGNTKAMDFLIKFEKEYPEVAEKYFNMKYEEII